ncbi:MAG: TSUP family transporter [Rhizobiaceae bacterium]
MDAVLSLTDLTAAQFLICVAVTFIAGMVRGFSGFALSALVMASLAIMIPPVELIAVCWFLEISASLLMVRGGVKEADMKVVFGLVIGSAMGYPMGLYLTNTLPVETSKAIALVVILVLAATQLLKLRPTFLATTPGLYVSGLLAGIATGLASVGGMIVALYVLARDAPARMMRGSLVMFLFIGSLVSFVYLSLFGMMVSAVVARGLILAVPCMIGVVVGKTLFMPSLEGYYRPFCLALLIFLASVGLVRLAAGG